MNEIGINIIDAILVFAAAAIPLFIAIKLDGKLRIISLILFVFVIIHGIYHVSEVLTYEKIGDDLIQPLSIAILIVFGLAYMRVGKRVTR